MNRGFAGKIGPKCIFRSLLGPEMTNFRDFYLQTDGDTTKLDATVVIPVGLLIRSIFFRSEAASHADFQKNVSFLAQKLLQNGEN